MCMILGLFSWQLPARTAKWIKIFTLLQLFLLLKNAQPQKKHSQKMTHPTHFPTVAYPPGKQTLQSGFRMPDPSPGPQLTKLVNLFSVLGAERAIAEDVLLRGGAGAGGRDGRCGAAGLVAPGPAAPQLHVAGPVPRAQRRRGRFVQPLLKVRGQLWPLENMSWCRTPKGNWKLGLKWSCMWGVAVVLQESVKLYRSF